MILASIPDTEIGKVLIEAQNDSQYWFKDKNKENKYKEEVYNMLKDDFDIMLLGGYGHIKRDLVIVPSYTAKGLEFDSVIIYNDMDNKYTKEDKYLYYVACTRAQHNLIIYNGEE